MKEATEISIVDSNSPSHRKENGKKKNRLPDKQISTKELAKPTESKDVEEKEEEEDEEQEQQEEENAVPNANAAFCCNPYLNFLFLCTLCAIIIGVSMHLFISNSLHNDVQQLPEIDFDVPVKMEDQMQVKTHALIQDAGNQGEPDDLEKEPPDDDEKEQEEEEKDIKHPEDRDVSRSTTTSGLEKNVDRNLGEQRQRQCNETLAGNNEEDYQGCQNVTESGYTCQKWKNQDPQEHEYTPLRYPLDNLGDHNFCRNPDGSGNRTRIWCFTTANETRWEYCQPIKWAEVFRGKCCSIVNTRCDNATHNGTGNECNVGHFNDAGICWMKCLERPWCQKFIVNEKYSNQTIDCWLVSGCNDITQLLDCSDKWDTYEIVKPVLPRHIRSHGNRNILEMRPATCCAINDIVCDDREGNQCGGFNSTFQNCWKKCLEVHWCTTFSFHYNTFPNCYLQSSCNNVSTTQHCTDQKDQYVIISPFRDTYAPTVCPSRCPTEQAAPTTYPTNAPTEEPRCDEKSYGLKGENYVGCQDVTKNGLACQKWSKKFDPDGPGTLYPDLGDINYCRNPDPDNKTDIWCYHDVAAAANETDAWEYCDPIKQLEMRLHECCTNDGTQCGAGKSGMDCSKGKDLTFEQCYQFCQGDSNCTQFVRNANSGSCYLESNCTSVVKGCTDWQRYRFLDVKPHDTRQFPDGVVIQVKHDQCCEQEYIKCGDGSNGTQCSRNINSFEDCMALCYNSWWCTQFSFGTIRDASGAHACWLESTCLQVTAGENCGSFNRYQILREMSTRSITTTRNPTPSPVGPPSKSPQNSPTTSPVVDKGPAGRYEGAVFLGINFKHISGSEQSWLTACTGGLSRPTLICELVKPANPGVVVIISAVYKYDLDLEIEHIIKDGLKLSTGTIYDTEHLNICRVSGTTKAEENCKCRSQSGDRVVICSEDHYCYGYECKDAKMHCDQNWRTVPVPTDCICDTDTEAVCKELSYCYQGKCQGEEFHKLCPNYTNADLESSYHLKTEYGSYEKCDCNNDGINECDPSKYCVEGKCLDDAKNVSASGSAVTKIFK